MLFFLENEGYFKKKVLSLLRHSEGIYIYKLIFKL